MQCFNNSLASDVRVSALFSDNNAVMPRAVLKFSGTKYEWKCDNKDCGKTWIATPKHIILDESGCPHCASSISEKLMSAWFESIGAPFVSQWRHEQCRDRQALPFDFYLDGFTIPFSVEVDNHDLIKMRFCVQHGISMLRITSRTIRFYPEKWKETFCSMLDHLTVERPLIVLEDNAQYRQMYRESLEGDSLLGPAVVFV